MNSLLQSLQEASSNITAKTMRDHLDHIIAGVQDEKKQKVRVKLSFYLRT